MFLYVQALALAILTVTVIAVTVIAELIQMAAKKSLYTYATLLHAEYMGSKWKMRKWERSIGD